MTNLPNTLWGAINRAKLELRKFHLEENPKKKEQQKQKDQQETKGRKQNHEKLELPRLQFTVMVAAKEPKESCHIPKPLHSSLVPGPRGRHGVHGRRHG